MNLAGRIRALRKYKNLSHRKMAKRTGLPKTYFSRVENAYIVPEVENLHKIAAALEIPLYVLLYDENPPPPEQPKYTKQDWASHGKGFLLFRQLKQKVACISEADRELLIYMAGQMASPKRAKKVLPP